MLRNREGFTLIELLIVVVIIGILAAIALPKFGSTREAAYWTTIKADLNNLRSAQEVYYQTSGAFQYGSLANVEYTASSGVNLGTISLENSGQGYTVTATHNALGADGCALAYGDVATLPTVPGGAAITAAQVGAPVCND